MVVYCNLFCRFVSLNGVCCGFVLFVLCLLYGFTPVGCFELELAILAIYISAWVSFKFCDLISL